MFGFLGFLLILFILIVPYGFSIISNLLRALFGLGKRNVNAYNQSQTSNSERESSTSSQKRTHSSGQRKKIFDEDEGGGMWTMRR